MNPRPSLAVAIVLYYGVFGVFGEVEDGLICPPCSPCPNIACPEYWFRVGEYCYRYHGIIKTWEAANTFCQDQNANLVSIHTEEESSTIFNLWQTLHGTSDPTYWIGLNDLDYEGNYRWSDGTPVNYFNWASYEPSDSDGIRECAMVGGAGGNYYRKQGWSDVPCTLDTRPFFCRFESN